jgi:hypothetical protein
VFPDDGTLHSSKQWNMPTALQNMSRVIDFNPASWGASVSIYSGFTRNFYWYFCHLPLIRLVVKGIQTLYYALRFFRYAVISFTTSSQQAIHLMTDTDPVSKMLCLKEPKKIHHSQYTALIAEFIFAPHWKKHWGLACTKHYLTHYQVSSNYATHNSV